MPRPPPSSFRRLSRYFSLFPSLTPSLSTCIPYAGGEQGHRYFYRHSSFTPRSTFFLPFSFSYPPHYSSSYSVSPSFHFTRTLLSTQPLFLHLSAPPSRAHFLRYVIHVLLTASLVSCPLSVLPYATVSSIILPPSHFSRQRSGVTLSRIDGNLYRWLLTEYHGFPRCWTIFATDFRSLEGKLDGEDRMKRKKDVRNGEEREEII